MSTRLEANGPYRGAFLSVSAYASVLKPCHRFRCAHRQAYTFMEATRGLCGDLGARLAFARLSGARERRRRGRDGKEAALEHPSVSFVSHGAVEVGLVKAHVSRVGFRQSTAAFGAPVSLIDALRRGFRVATVAVSMQRRPADDSSHRLALKKEPSSSDTPSAQQLLTASILLSGILRNFRLLLSGSPVKPRNPRFLLALQGDGGGPMVCLVDGFYELAGLVSWGFGCGRPDVPGVYVKVSAFIGWINQIISVNNL
ncbi:hypothetical protein MRX96_050502 [Rhipicephalus microplus]